MRTKKRNLSPMGAIALLGLLAGCSSSEWTEGTQNSGNAIRFAVTAGKQTKAGVVDNGNVTAAPFGLYAYHHAQAWTDFLADGIGKPNFMSDQTVSYDATNDEWTYMPLKFWPSDNVSFFGYWPQTAGIAAPKTIVADNLPTIHFTQDMDAAKMTDFVVCNAVDRTKDKGTVKLTFKHVLTRLNFSARLDRDISADAATKAFVKALTIKHLDDKSQLNTLLYSDADYTLSATGNGEWDYTTATPATADIDVTGIMNLSAQTFGTYGSTSVPIAQDGTATKLLRVVGDVDASGVAADHDEYLFLIPPRGKDGIQDNTDLMVQIDYDIVTKDDNIEDGNVTSPNSSIISLPFTKLQEGKAYNIVFTFGLNEVKLDVDVEDWKEDGTHAPSYNAASNSDTDIMLAWQALNATKAADVNATYFVIHVPTAPAGDLDLSSITGIDDFQDDDQLELIFDDGVDFTGKITTPAGWTYITRTIGDASQGTQETRHIIVKAVPKSNMPVGGLNIGTAGDFQDGENIHVEN